MERQQYIYESLRALDRHGGSAQLDPTIYEEVLSALRPKLGAADFAGYRGEPRWKNDLRQASRTMIEYGLMKRSVRNIWEITDAGREYLSAYPNVALWESGGAKGTTFTKGSL
jgi:hypothetical protein